MALGPLVVESSGPMLRQALILAAGRGRPVAAPDVPNCLATVGGAELLLRSLRVLRRVGVRRVGITLGWQGALVERQVDKWRAAEPVATLPDEICFFHNPGWDRPNGLSVLAARDLRDRAGAAADGRPDRGARAGRAAGRPTARRR